MLLKVVDKMLLLNGKTAVSVEGDCTKLRNGLSVTDERGKVFIIESVGMTHYTNSEDWKTKADILLACSDFSSETLIVNE